MAAEINSRYSDISYALHRQSKPTMTYRVADVDREQIAPDVDETTEFGEAVDELAEELSAYDDHDHIVLPDAVQDTSAVTWDPRVTEAMEMATEMKLAIEATCSIPGLFSGLMLEGAMSGVALKRIMLRLYANTLQTQSATEVAVNELMAMSGLPPIEWMNALNAMEEETNDQEDEEGMLSDNA